MHHDGFRILPAQDDRKQVQSFFART